VRKVRLPLPAELRAPLLRRIAARERWSVLGGSVAFTVAFVVVLAAGWREQTGVVTMLALGIGASVGGVAAIMTGRHALNPDAPRVARARATSLRDYLTPGELLTIRLAPVAALASVVAATVLLAVLSPGRTSGAGAGPSTVAWVAAAATLLVWAASELVARRVLLRPQHAASQLELAWDDICRADALRGLFANAVIMAVVTSITALFAVGMTVTDPQVRHGAMDLTLVLGLVMLAVSTAAILGMLVPGFVAHTGPYRQRVLRRLWAGSELTGAGS
jgi:hypothetical protein